jgi:hypothetical protein
MPDLFGDPVLTACDGPLTEEEILENKRAQRRRLSIPRGHAAPPGTGPEGEKCKTCEHMVRHRYARTYFKCKLNEAKWTRGPKTDIKANSPACEKWEKENEAAL